MKIRLTLEVDYDISAVTHAGISEETAREELEAVLTNSVDRLVGEGGLSGDTLATVNTWEATLHDGHGFLRSRAGFNADYRLKIREL